MKRPKVACIRPCKDCPFLRCKSYLTSSRAHEISTAVMAGSNFHCHKTIEHDDDGEGVVIPGKSNLCAGGLIMMEKADPPPEGSGCYANGLVRIGHRLGFFDPDALDLSADVYESPQEMAAGHNS